MAPLRSGGPGPWRHALPVDIPLLTPDLRIERVLLLFVLNGSQIDERWLENRHANSELLPLPAWASSKLAHRYARRVTKWRRSNGSH